MTRGRANKCFGIVGGLGPLAGADIFLKLVKSTPALSDKEHFDIVFEQHPLDDGHAVADETFVPNSRKFYVYNTIKELEKRGVDEVVLTCFISHTFLDEIAPEVKPEILNIMVALQHHVAESYPEARRLGVLTSTYVRGKRLFERTFGENGRELLYPRPEIQESCLMQAVYGPQGIKAGRLRGHSIELIERAVDDLVEQGAEVILPGLTEIPAVLESLSPAYSVPIVDSNQVYADYAVSHRRSGPAEPRKIGVIGGVGPAATVDFMDKVILHTDACRDQEHVKMVVEHNPQIPDRTENLIASGDDPTIPLYAACKKLEAQDAQLIAIPCNTAHAYVERIQRFLAIPIVNMLFETVQYIKRHHGACKTAGLLATTGTVRSQVYHEVFEGTGVALVVPDDAHQAKVMNAIYGETGVKAGHTDGQCREDLLQALEHLVERGAEVVILGCTELPLILSQSDDFAVAGTSIVLLDPTDILARRCVALCKTT
ncbi:MAG: amino acid racemase [Pseudomonadota bacterium]